MLGAVLGFRRRSKSVDTHSWFEFHCSPRGVKRCNPMLLRHGPASIWNLLGRLHWRVLVWDVDDVVLQPHVPKMVDGSSKWLDHYRTSRFQS